MEKKNKVLCNICNKYYSSRQSLHNHKKRIHSNNIKTNVNQNASISLPNTSNLLNNEHLQCNYCSKTFTRKDNKNRHEKKCKHNKNTDMISKEQYIHDIKKLEKEITEKLTKQFMKMLEEKQMIQTNCTNNSTQNTNSHNKTLIGTQNITISLGSEDVLGTLSQKEKLKILNERYMSVLDLIKLMHCSNKYPQFNNSIITNLKSEFALTYDEEKNQFITTDKDELISDIISYRTANVTDLLEENKQKVDKITKEKVEELIIMLDNETNSEKILDFNKKYNKKVMSAIYDYRDDLKQKMKKTKQK